MDSITSCDSSNEQLYVYGYIHICNLMKFLQFRLNNCIYLPALNKDAFASMKFYTNINLIARTPSFSVVHCI